VYRELQFLRFVGIRESWEDNISEEEQWVKINIHRRTEKGCFEKSQKYCSTGDSRTEYSS
jgi:hypothetical protein